MEFFDKYEEIEGEGSELGVFIRGYGPVHKYRRKQDGREVAVQKLIKFAGEGVDQAKMVDALHLHDRFHYWNHPNVVKQHEAYEFSDLDIFVMEFWPSFNLNQEGPFTEDQARHIFKQMVDGVCVCHNRGMRFENFRNFRVDKKNSDDPMKWKIKVMGSGDRTHRHLVWELGDALHVMLCGKHSRDGLTTPNEWIHYRKTGTPKFRHENWKKVSEKTKVLISQTLRPFRQRPSLQDFDEGFDFEKFEWKKGYPTFTIIPRG